MCGFVGIVNFEKDITQNKNILEKMNQSLTRHDSDEEVFYTDSNILLGHKRLIGCKQSMTKTLPYGKYVIVYNGQLYNTEDLRKILVGNDFTFNGHSDTEVLLYSYIHYGKDVVKYLNGIFAFAIWDSMEQELFIARDHFRH